MVKVRYSQGLNDLIEFDVELSSIPLDDHWGKDVTVNWRLYDGFDANETFWTDSNGLEMQERHLNLMAVKSSNISANYFPITQAVATRDVQAGSNKQVTIMVDRPRGGSVDLAKSTIEIMHHRRLVNSDHKGLEESLDEQDGKNQGIKVNGRYFMHIFDITKGKSL